MSAHYDKYGLNTYRTTPYFQAHVPASYPYCLVMQKCRAFRRLPPRLQELAGKAKQWAQRVGGYPAGIMGIEDWYDDEGYELKPGTGMRLTDEEIDAEWDTYHPNLGLDDFEVDDIPIPPGGFADPDTWEEPEPEEDEDGITEEQLLKDIASHGREYVVKDYGIPADQAEKAESDEDLARVILQVVQKRRADNSGRR